jgi:putative DNA primase/helicase
MPETTGRSTTLRFIDTSDLPQGFDAGDLVAQGITGPDLIAWLKARVRPGVPPADAPAAVAKPERRPQKTPAPQGGDAGVVLSKGETSRSDVKPATPPPVAQAPLEAASAPLVPARGGNVATLPVAPPQPAPDDDEDMLPPEYSDDSLARVFTHAYAGTFRYVASWGRWLQWDGARWAHDESLRSFHAVRLVLREQANEVLQRPELAAKARTIASGISSARTMGNVERIARADPRHAAVSTQFDADPWLLNTPAGIVDLRTGALRPAGMDDYCTKVTRVAPEGECPTWLRFLSDVTDGNVELQQYLQRVAGYCLTGSTREHALFFFYGTGRNGKGTFLNMLEWIMGDYSRVAPMTTFTESKNERHTTELAFLMGARIVTSQETDEGKRWDETRIKSITGGDPITARFMRQDDFTFTPQFKLMISGNHKPGLRNVDEAMRARLHLVPFTITVPPEKRDPQLAEKLRAEAGGILRWMIEGCREWNRIRLQPPRAVKEATDEYFGAQDVVGQWLAEECEVLPGNRAHPGELYNSFTRYCASVGEYSMPQKRWLDALELKGVRKIKSNGVRYLHGLRLMPRREECGPGQFDDQGEPLL